MGRPNIFLTGLTAKGAETAGRYVTVGAGESTLTVHVASGRASLSGVATLDGKPCVGAMVLLVPITIEDRNSITVLLRDQTNTDGSFDLANIIPGQYILVAIDHGWQINWGDPLDAAPLSDAGGTGGSEIVRDRETEHHCASSLSLCGQGLRHNCMKLLASLCERF